MHPVVWLILNVINIYIWIVIIAVVVNLLIHFNIINRYQPLVQQISTALARLTEPVFRRVRKVIPPMGGFDLSPIIVLLGLQFLYRIIVWYLV